MKAVTVDQFGEIEQMHWSDLPTPQPLDHEVQIEVHAASINPVDWKIRKGALQKLFPCEFPIIPGWDAAGIVSAIGKNVKNFRLGDPVYCYCRKPIVQWGAYAEYLCFDAMNVAIKPKVLNFNEAAAVPLAGLTAWQVLHEKAMLKPGQKILIHAGSGGVGSFAIPFAKSMGAFVYTTASKKHHSYVKSLGADEIIDYQSQDFVSLLLEREPSGIDVVLDAVGGDVLERSFDVVKKGGHLVSVVHAVNQEKAKEKGIFGNLLIVRPDGKQLKEICALFDEHKITKPLIEVYPFSEYAKATKKSEEGHSEGKIILEIKNSR